MHYFPGFLNILMGNNYFLVSQLNLIGAPHSKQSNKDFHTDSYEPKISGTRLLCSCQKIFYFTETYWS